MRIVSPLITLAALSLLGGCANTPQQTMADPASAATQLAHHHAANAYLGIGVSPADETLRDQLGLPKGTGLVVDFVAPDSPAAKAGIAAHDVVKNLNGKAVTTPEDFLKSIRGLKPGDAVTLSVLHDGKTNQVKATLAQNAQPAFALRGNLNLSINGDGQGGWRIDGDDNAGRDSHAPDGHGPNERGLSDADAAAIRAQVMQRVDEILGRVEQELQQQRDGMNYPHGPMGPTGPGMMNQRQGGGWGQWQQSNGPNGSWQGGGPMGPREDGGPMRGDGPMNQSQRGGGPMGNWQGRGQGPGAATPNGNAPTTGPAERGSMRGRLSQSQASSDTKIMVQSDQEGAIRLTDIDGDKHFTARDKDGKVIFDGPINTEDQRKALPPELAAKLKKMEGNATP